ncbi:hypothetical protein JCM6882_001825 [Rhodosporidiobolus microsporus]
MLDRIATELLFHIVRFVAPLKYLQDDYAQRRADLKSVSLVDRRTRAIAQPMLPEVFVVRERTDIDVLGALDNDGQERGASVKVLAVLGPAYNIEDEATSILAAALDSCPLVEELNLSDWRPLHLACLGGMNNLSRLIVHSCTVQLAHPPPPPLFSLVELSFSACKLSPDTNFYTSFLSARWLPALRAVGFEEAHSLPARSFPLLDTALSSQLEVLSLDYFTAECFPAPPFPPPERIQLRAWFDSEEGVKIPAASPFPLRHLTFSAHDFPGLDYGHGHTPPPALELTSGLRDIVAGVRAVATLHTLELPDSFHPYS